MLIVGKLVDSASHGATISIILLILLYIAFSRGGPRPKT